MSVRILHGDVREVLKTLPSDHFDMVLTSPPYWGLRSYLPEGHPDKGLEIGLEPTMQGYLETMVGVCREVKRVLKPAGTFWLNVGSCYATSKPSGPQGKSGQRSGRTFTAQGAGGAFCETNPSPSRLPQHAPACGSDGKEPSNLSALDLSYRGRDGEYRDASSSHNAHMRQPLDGFPWLDGMTSRDIAHLDSELADELSRLSPKALSFFGYDPGAFDFEATASSFPRPKQRYSCDEPQKKGRASDRKKTSGQSSSRTLGMGASERACNCNSCGLCFVYLSTMALKVKPKDLLLVPDLLALALQADGWYVRSEIIWAKPNPMPESVTDRPTCAHEKVWLLTKGPKYFYDAAAIAEVSECQPGSIADVARGGFGGKNTAPGKEAFRAIRETRNARNVWSIASQPFSGAHFATMPRDLAERCIKAGCPAGGHVLDPFGGAGTTGLVADRLGRNATLIEINPAYREMGEHRIRDDAPLFAEVYKP